MAAANPIPKPSGTPGAPQGRSGAGSARPPASVDKPARSNPRADDKDVAPEDEVDLEALPENDNEEEIIANDNAAPRKPLWARSAEAERGTVPRDSSLDPSAEIDTPGIQTRRTRELPDAMKRNNEQEAKDTLERLKASPSERGPSGPNMSRAESAVRNRMRKNASQLRERKSGSPSWTMGDAQAGQVEQALRRNDQALRAKALAQELERLQKEGAAQQGQTGAGGAWSRFRNARQQAQTEKALKKLRSNQAAGMMALTLLYSMALMTWYHSLYAIAILYFAGRFSKFLRRWIPPMGTLLDPRARLAVLRGGWSEPSVGTQIAEVLTLSFGLVCVAALDILLTAAVVGAVYAIDAVCDTPVVGLTCDIIGEISKFFGV